MSVASGPARSAIHSEGVTLMQPLPVRHWLEPAEENRRFLLLDGAQCESLDELLKQLHGIADSEIQLFDGLLADGSGNASVWLHQLQAGVDVANLLVWLGGKVKSFGALTFIDTALSEGELSQRLMRRLDARFPNGKEFLARFYDGRVLPWLVNVMTQEQRNAFLGIGCEWWFVTHAHVWDVLILTAPQEDLYDPPLQLDDTQRRQLLADTYPYTLIDHFRLVDEDLLDRVPRNDQYRFIRGCMRVGENYGIHDGKRVVMICTWALLLGEGFHQTPDWVLRLEDFSEGRRTARDIGNEVWPVVESWN